MNAHFLRVLSDGRWRSRSKASQQLRQLATAILIAVPALDAEVIDGLHEWIDLAKAAPTTAGDILESH